MKPFAHILAKSAENGGTTLIEHLEDVLAATVKMAYALGNFDVELARKGAILHDIGKAHPHFQNRLQGLKKEDFLALPPHRHELSSLLFLPIFPKEEWSVLIDMVVAHHKSVYQDASKRGLLDLVDNERNLIDIHVNPWDEWSPDAINILEYMGLPVRRISEKEARGAFEYVITYCESKTKGWSRWRGLLMSADHFASAFIEKTEKELEKIFQTPDLSAFASRINPLYPLSQISTEDHRPHTIVVAPTGAGKTDFLMRRCRGRVFYTLPFQASINAMYHRMKNMVPDTDIRVLHAASRLTVSNDGVEEKILQTLVGSSIKVLTPHQIAAIAFGTRAFESVALDIAGMDVILDEIHSYSDTARSMVIEIVKVLKKLGCRIHIGSATMPTDLLRRIGEILGGAEQVYTVRLPDDILDTFDRHIVVKHNNDENLLSVIEQTIDKKEKVLIVCNRVDKAQQYFSFFSEKFPSTLAMLIHSRFKRQDRAELEHILQNQFNTASGACLAISTQVVEVSLDISFDCMITDCAPLDSLIQRFGRIHRKRNEQTIGTYKEVHVIAPPTNPKEALPYKPEVLLASFDQLPDKEVLKERELQEKIDRVYPTIDIQEITLHAAYQGEQFTLQELSHRPKSVIMECLDIESSTCILASDKDRYISARSEERTLLEIPLPRSAKFKKFTRLEELEIGSRPFVVPDELYSPLTGLHLQEIDNHI